MASSISWLDTSVEEQKKMREILGLFTDTDTREELGLGQIRDALGDGLFPGSSTLHTRARYFLFIPWTFQSVSAKSQRLEHARDEELRLVQALKVHNPHERGIIGVNAGMTLKSVASTLYWSALGAYGILTSPNLNREQTLLQHGSPLTLGLEEAKPQTFSVWRANIPEAPEGFPSEVPNGMELTYEEASWLQERFIESQPGTLLAHLTLHAPQAPSSTPWEDPAALSATGKPKELLEHARIFSQTIHGAQLLYNLLIAESYEHEGFTKQQGKVEQYSDALRIWADEVSHTNWHVDWNVDRFFDLVTMARNGSQVSHRSESFVRDWVERLKEIDPLSVIHDTRARALVRKQERSNKGKMARIGNRDRLETWGGSSGASRYTYRWGYVRQILVDIHDGLARLHEPTPGHESRESVPRELEPMNV